MKNYFIKSLGWSAKITVLTVLLAALFATLSTLFLSNSSILLSIGVVFFFISFGIISDTIGLSAAAAKEIPFCAYCSREQIGEIHDSPH